MTQSTQKTTQNFDFHQARQNMVDGQVRTNKVTSHALIRRLRDIPREIFVASEQAPFCYIDEDLPLSGGRFLLEPMVLARLIQAAELTQTDNVLDVGCASGYSSVIMAGLCGSVIGVDRDKNLIDRATNNVRELSVPNCSFIAGPMLNGYASKAPYDAILVNGSVAELPNALFDQLKDGGRLLCVLKQSGTQAIALGPGKAMIYKKSGSVISGRALFDAASPYIENPPANNKFVF